MHQDPTQDRPLGQPAGKAPPAGYPLQNARPRGSGPPEARRRGMPPWALELIGPVALVIIVAAGVLTTLVLIGQSQTGQDGVAGVSESVEPRSVVSEFYGGLHLHDYEGAHSYLGGDLAGRYTADDLARMWRPLEEGGDHEGLGVVLGFPMVEKVDGSRATVRQTLTAAGGSAYIIVLQLEKSEDGWKIVGAEPRLIPEYFNW